MTQHQYPQGHQVYGSRGAGVFGAVLTSAVTSSVITLSLLFVTGNLSVDALETFKMGSSAPQTHSVPSLIGLPTPSAKDVLKMSGLRMVVVEERPDPSVAKGNIAEQRPLADSDVPTGGEVKVWISTGPPKVKVPDIIGKNIEEVKKQLSAAGLMVGKTTFEGEGGPGEIESVTPQPGTEVEKGTKLSIIAAPLALPVPDLVGMRTAKAKQTVKKSGFGVGKISWRYNENRPAHLVLEQKPAAGTKAPPGSLIDLVLNPE